MSDPIEYHLRNAKSGHEFLNNNQKIIPFIYMGDLKNYSRSEKLPDSLIQMVRMFGIEYCIDKCVTLNIKRGNSWVQGNIIAGWRHEIFDLGILYANQMDHTEVKERLKESISDL